MEGSVLRQGQHHCISLGEREGCQDTSENTAWRKSLCKTQHLLTLPSWASSILCAGLDSHQRSGMAPTTQNIRF